MKRQSYLKVMRILDQLSDVSLMFSVGVAWTAIVGIERKIQYYNCSTNKSVRKCYTIPWTTILRHVHETVF